MLIEGTYETDLVQRAYTHHGERALRAIVEAKGETERAELHFIFDAWLAMLRNAR